MGSCGSKCCSKTNDQESQFEQIGDIQRIIIPQGLINPTCMNIIEIPPNLTETPLLYARRNSVQLSNTLQRITVEKSRMKTTPEHAIVPLRQNDANYFDMPANLTSPVPAANRTEHALQLDLDEREQTEREILDRDLEQFQQARRRLVAHTSELAATSNLENEN